jgi:dihydrodipicolinate synthase/N-acetylneuraminate lyase
MRAHLQYLLPFTQSFLVPGSTGEGWEMEPDEIKELLSFMLDEAQKQQFSVLIGVLKKGRGKAHAAVKEMVSTFFGLGAAPSAEEYAQKRICGFAVTAPSGRDLEQALIKEELKAVLSEGHPVSLYQLPQITQNEIEPETAAELAAEFANFYLLKDSSGKDRIASSGADLANVVLVRGAEEDYAPHLKEGGGEYDGFLLSTVNCFPAELKSLIDLLEAGEQEAAEELSRKISRIIRGMFEAVAELDFANMFTNANKALDHFFAFGPPALKKEGPLTHSGRRLPRHTIEKAGELLEAEGLMPRSGYYA